MNKIEWLFALLYANNSEPIQGITRFEKLLFYYLNKYKFVEDAKKFNFEAYRFGPHSDHIRDILYALEDKDLIDIKTQSTDNLLEIDVGDDRDFELRPINYDKQEIYSLTPKGKEIAERVIQKLSNFENISNFKREYSRMKLNKLIRIVYAEFPEMTIKSEIIKEI